MHGEALRGHAPSVCTPLMAIRSTHQQPVIQLLTRGSGRVGLRSHRRCCWRTQSARNQRSWSARPLALPCCPACLLSPACLSSRAILACRYSGTCLLYRHGCQTAEATEEAGIDDSGPTLLGGGHHQKEADFARVRSEVTEGVPPRSQLAATSSGTEAEVDIRSATCYFQQAMLLRRQWEGAKLSGVHGSLGPRGAKGGGRKACACSAAFRVLSFRDPSSFFFPPQSSVPLDRIQLCAYC